jgi:hypothetical protein
MDASLFDVVGQKAYARRTVSDMGDEHWAY